MPHQVSRLYRLLQFFCILALAGCATGPQRAPFTPPVYPPAPAEPRFIYEATLRSSNNITEPTFGDRLREIATGVSVDPGGLAKPYGVAVKNNKVYVTDTQQRAIILFDLNNRKFKTFGTEGEGRLLKPLGIDISSRDEVFVADITAKRVVVFDLDGNFLRLIKDDRVLERPSGVAVSPDGNIAYVIDTGGINSENHRVYMFDANSGAYIKTIGRRGQGEGEFNLPLQASTAADGTLYIVDSGNFRVQAFTKDGQFLRGFGSLGRQSGQFSRPKGIATDREGNVYVVDTAFGNFQIFDANGQLLLFVGKRNTAGRAGEFSLPAGIDVDENGRIYVVDQFFRKVDIFRPVDIPALEVFK